MNPPARVVSVKMGRPRTIELFGRQVTRAIWKEPVASPEVPESWRTMAERALLRLRAT